MLRASGAHQHHTQVLQSHPWFCTVLGWNTLITRKSEDAARSGVQLPRTNSQLSWVQGALRSSDNADWGKRSFCASRKFLPTPHFQLPASPAPPSGANRMPQAFLHHLPCLPASHSYSQTHHSVWVEGCHTAVTKAGVTGGVNGSLTVTKEEKAMV